MTPQPTPAELEAAESVCRYLATCLVEPIQIPNPCDVSNIIAAHRAPMGNSLVIALTNIRNEAQWWLKEWGQHGPPEKALVEGVIREAEMALNSKADPAQAHAADMEALLQDAQDAITFVSEEEAVTSPYGLPSHIAIAIHTLLATLDAERRAQKAEMK